MIPAAVALLIAGAGNLLLTPLILKAAHTHKWYDEPNHRTVHTTPVPRLGGVGFVAATVAAVIAVVVVFDLEISRQLLFIAAGLLVNHTCGVVDDFITIRAIFKLVGQVLGSLLFIAGGVVITEFTLPFGNFFGFSSSVSLGTLGPVITLIWIIGVTNAVNLMDGLDGLAGGISVWILAGMGVFFGLGGNMIALVLSCAAIGSLLAFLRYNLPEARIFMGDGGSLWLGSLAAILPLVGGPDSLIALNPMATVVLLAIPIMDIISAVLRRLRDRQPIHHPDKGHVHHKMLNIGYTTPQVLAILYALGAILALPTAMVPLVGTPGQHMLPAGAGLIAGIFFLSVHYVNRYRTRSIVNTGTT